MKKLFILIFILPALSFAGNNFNILDIVSSTITGGSINGAAIGATTPSTGAFTTLSATTALPITSGGTGSTTASSALTALGGAGLVSPSFTTPNIGAATGTSLVASGGISATTLTHSQQEVDTSYTFNAPTTGQTVTLSSGTGNAIIAPAGTLAALTIVLPGCTSGYDGSIARFSSSQLITSLTVSATSGSVADGSTTLALGGGNGYICRGSTTTWYRMY